MDGTGLRLWREAKKMRTGELAELLGYRRRQIERLESKDTPVRRSIRLALAAIDRGLTPVE